MIDNYGGNNDAKNMRNCNVEIMKIKNNNHRIIIIKIIVAIRIKNLQ